ncbi:Kirola [Sesamum alatum]|uniref:Kirola n=1 Tax=Sesamum alatum TaxID=300844 RepID=A0AAE2CII6_9LAMI|nr:Kirola [Sesamum alatum]
MGLSGKLVSQTNIKSDGGDLLFELFRYKLSYVPFLCPQIIHTADLVAGQWGAVGSVITCNYTVDGEKKFFKAVLETLNEKKRSITYKVVEGHGLERFTSFKITFSISGCERDLVVKWTFEYERKSECVPHPHELVDLCSTITKQIEHCYSLVPN